MKQKNIVSKLILLIFISLIFFQVTVNNMDKTSSSDFNPPLIRSAQLTQVSQFEIIGNSGWAALSSMPWFQGSGTFHDPYIISNISIITDDWSLNDLYCILIKNSNVYFIIQNSSFFFNSYGSGGYEIAAIYMENVENGIIYNNEFNSDDSECIQLRESNNLTLINNNINKGGNGIRISNSDHINVSGNSITDCYGGIQLSSSSYNSFYNNEIRLTNNFFRIYGISDPWFYGISLYSSHNNNISGNHFYCVPNPVKYEGSSFGNLDENNYIHTCVFYDYRGILDMEMLISGLLLIGVVIAIAAQHSRFPNKKKVSGILFTIISLCAIGLLIHGVFNLNYGYIPYWEQSYYWMGLFGLFVGYSASLLIGIRLIIRSRNKTR